MVRAEKQRDSCEGRGGEPALQGTVLGRPEEQLVVAEEEIQPLSVDEVELELLRQFDLAWQYGPCTGEDPASPRSTCWHQTYHSHLSEAIQAPACPFGHCLLRLGSIEVPPHPSTHIL